MKAPRTAAKTGRDAVRLGTSSWRAKAMGYHERIMAATEQEFEAILDEPKTCV